MRGEKMKKSFIILLAFILLISINTVIFAEGTRDNPYQIGERFTIQGEGLMSGEVKFEFELLETKKGNEAYKLIAEKNPILANHILKEAEDAEKEIFIAKFFGKALELEEEPYSINSQSIFAIMDSTGSVYSIESGYFTNNPFGEIDEVYEGGEITGWITCFVKPGDSPLLLVETEGDSAFIEPKGEKKNLINLTLDKNTYKKLNEQAKEEGITLNQYISKLIKE